MGKGCLLLCLGLGGSYVLVFLSGEGAGLGLSLMGCHMLLSVLTGCWHSLPILKEYTLSMATLWVEYGYTMGRVWVHYG